MEKLKPQIVFEDKYLLLLDKPAGMVVNRAETTKGKETLQDWLEGNIDFWRKQKGRKSEEFKDFFARSGIVHRLDKETSGLLLVAKDEKVFADLQRQFKEKEVKKRYLALVHGQLVPKEGVVEASIARSPFNRQKFGVFLQGKKAKTVYRVLDYFQTEGGNFSFLELTPQTGRTHQLRVHLKFLGHPVFADEKYGGRKKSREDRLLCPRQFLHASFLSFTHPVGGKEMAFKSKLPSDLQIAMIKLGLLKGSKKYEC